MDEKKVKESITLRGICSVIQAMAFPTFSNLAEFLKNFGYRLTKIKE